MNLQSLVICYYPNDLWLLQQPAILEPEAEENNAAASLFDNDNDIQVEAVQESGDVPVDNASDHDHDIDMISPTTNSDHDIAMPDNEDSEHEADRWSNQPQ